MGIETFTILAINTSLSSDEFLRNLSDDKFFDRFRRKCQRLKEKYSYQWEEFTQSLIGCSFNGRFIQEYLEVVQKIISSLMDKFPGLILDFYVFDDYGTKDKYTFRTKDIPRKKELKFKLPSGLNIISVGMDTFEFEGNISYLFYDEYPYDFDLFRETWARVNGEVHDDEHRAYNS